MIGAVLLELNAAEEVDIGGVCAEIREGERDFRLGNGLILFGIIDEALLDEVSAAAAPACPEAELEEANGQGGGGDCADHPDEGLLPADLGPDILAEDCCLEIG